MLSVLGVCCCGAVPLPPHSPNRVFLLHLAGVARVNWDMRLLALVFGLPLLAVSAIVFVCDIVLRAGALFLTVGIVWSCRRLRALCFANI